MSWTSFSPETNLVWQLLTVALAQLPLVHLRVQRVLVSVILVALLDFIAAGRKLYRFPIWLLTRWYRFRY
jgi:hypothetical protein